MTFRRHFVGQSISSSASFALSVALTPILTRLYAPSDYGEFAIANGVAVFMSTLFLLSMPSVIPLAKSPTEARRLVNVSIFLTVMATSASVAVSLLWLAVGTHNASIGLSVARLLLPVLVLSVCLQRISQNISILEKGFSALALSRVAHPIAAKSFAIACATVFVPKGAFLILAEALGNVVQCAVILRTRGASLFKIPKLFSLNRLKASLEVASRNRQFSVYDNLNNLLMLGFATAQLVVFTSNFTAAEAGLFSLSFGVMNLPIQLVSLATAALIYSRLIGIFSESPERGIREIMRIVGVYAALAAVPYTLVWFFGEPVFTLAFGQRWSESGQVAAMIAMPTFLAFVVTPIQSAFRLTNTAKIGLIVDAIFIPLILLVIYASSRHATFMHTVAELSILTTVHRVVMLISILGVTFRFSQPRKDVVTP